MSATAQWKSFGPFFQDGELVQAPRLYHYVAGTSSTLLNAYTDRLKQTPAANPIVGDVNGMVSGYFDGLYKIVVCGPSSTGPTDGVLDVWDNVSISDPSMEWFNALDWGVKNDGTETGAAITAFLDLIVSYDGGTAYFPAGIYSYAVSPNFARMGVNIKCDGGTIFKHTGSGNAFVADGGTGVGLYGLRFTGISVQGNANSTNGFYARSIHHSYFDVCCKGAAITGAGIYIEGCLANEFSTPRISTNEGVIAPLPLYGMFFTRKTTGGNVNSNANTILNPVMEGLTNSNGTGLYFDYADSNKVIGGTSEGNKQGIHFTANAQRNVVTGIDLESNADYDLYCEGAYNAIFSINATGIVRFTTGNGSWNSIIGGLINQLTLDTNAAYNTVLGITTGSTGGTLTDTGVNTFKANNYDGINGVLFPESAKRTKVVATGALPAAAAAMDSTELIEDAGAGAFNHIIYAGGLRLRRNGYVSF